MKRGACFRKTCSHLLPEENGGIEVIVAVSMVVLLIMSALAIDVGNLYLKKQQLQSATDAAALAGATALNQGTAEVNQRAVAMGRQNQSQAAYSVSADTTSDTVLVKGTEHVPLWFARILGKSSVPVTTESKAVIGTVDAMKGVSPVALTQQRFYQYSTGQTIDLTASPGHGQQGNFGFLDVGSGAKSVGEAIRYGSSQVIQVGTDTIKTETGLDWGKVRSAVQYRLDNSTCQDWNFASGTPPSDCSQIIYICIVKSLNVNGKKPVSILGFAPFYLTGVNDHQIIGKFIRDEVTLGQTGKGTNFGTYGVRLVQP